MAHSGSALLDIVGEGRLLDSESISGRATSYWNPAPMRAKALLMPGTTDEMAGILKHCNASGQSVITQGGLTNCVHAVEPAVDDVVLSTEKMTGILEIDRIGGTAIVEAGTVLQTVQETRRERGLLFSAGSRCARQLHDRRQHRDQRGRHQRAALRHDAQSRARPRSGHGGRHGHVVDEPHAQEQCRLRHEADFHRQRRHAGRRNARGTAPVPETGEPPGCAGGNDQHRRCHPFPRQAAARSRR